MSLRILIIDDHPLFLDGMASALRRFDDDAAIETAANAEDGLAATQAREFDLVLLDLNLPGMNGLAAINEFHQRFPALPVVVLSSSERPDDIRQAINGGALGFIPKTSSTHAVFETLRQVLEGRVCVPAEFSADSSKQPLPVFTAPRNIECGVLSLRQMEVLACLCQGLSNKQIADALLVSEKTVKNHVSCVFRALGVVNRTQAVLAAKKTGMFAG
ncbi:MAG: response regulator transcription factor [Gammaproteobacteria bacterium]|nr:response regulator transcription factor [Gammaproteobacteria bacterium]